MTGGPESTWPTEIRDAISVEIETGDVVDVQADLVALKSGERLYGATVAVADALKRSRIDVERRIGKGGKPVLIDSRGHLGADAVLFQPAPDILSFAYRDARNFAKNVLASAARLAPRAQTIAITLHGPGFGLDVREAFEAEIGGLIEGIRHRRYPSTLRRILVVEHGKERAAYLRSILKELLPRGIALAGARPGRGTAPGAARQPRRQSKAEVAGFERLRRAGVKSREKPLVFVAMPFSQNLDDVFDYGITNAVRRGLGRDVLCERADLASYTGDVMQYVRGRIAGAVLVIADLTGTNANVYLEIGFAWGVKRPTVLLVASNEKNIKFDVRSQRCLEYSSIRDLETKLSKELKMLKPRLLVVRS